MSLAKSYSLRRLLSATALSAAVLGMSLSASPSFANVAAPATAITASTEAAVAPQDESIRPFHVSISEEALTDLRRRVTETRWPDREKVADASQGVQLDRLEPLVRYWGSDYDWRKGEARLNAVPQFITTIDGVDIQFMHIRSKHKGAMPLLMTHGWPGSPFEMLKSVGPLTDPTAHGGKAEDAFDLILPTYPGYGFSGKPTEAWDPARVARAWDVLMKRLGYKNYVSQGGDWGAIISQVMAVHAPEGLLGIHTNMPGTVPSEVLKLVRAKQPVPASYSAQEKVAYAGLETFYGKGFGYAEMMNTRPQTLGYGLSDSPVGLAAFLYEKIATWTHSGGNPESVLTRDEILDNITLYWLTNTGTSSSRSYWDAAQGEGGPFNAIEISKVPVAVTVFPGEIYRAPRSWGEKSFKKLIYWNEVDKGGHFAAWEQPELFATEIRAAFRPLREKP